MEGKTKLNAHVPLAKTKPARVLVRDPQDSDYAVEGLARFNVSTRLFDVELKNKSLKHRKISLKSQNIYCLKQASHPSMPRAQKGATTVGKEIMIFYPPEDIWYIGI